MPGSQSTLQEQIKTNTELQMQVQQLQELLREARGEPPGQPGGGNQQPYSWNWDQEELEESDSDGDGIGDWWNDPPPSPHGKMMMLLGVGNSPRGGGSGMVVSPLETFFQNVQAQDQAQAQAAGAVG